MLAYLHRCNILYQDLKPENVMIDADRYPSLIDFGLAKELVNDKTCTLNQYCPQDYHEPRTGFEL
jgi:serine/threonine protein kinase